APAGVAGAISYRGVPVPVLDLSSMTLGRPAARRMNTRIVLVRWPDRDGALRLLGLIAEKVNNTMRRNPDDFLDPGIGNPDAPYLGKVATDAQGLVRRVEIDKLISP
ncbi:chemotaxis protein CheW, partial [Massilia sp. CCM 8733]